MRILMVMHVPFNRNAGAARVQIEIADELEKEGHTIDFFDYHRAFPFLSKLKNRRLKQLLELFAPTFMQKAQAFVAAHSKDYDIVDAHHGNLEVSKTALRFQGLLVCRSVGHYRLIEAFNEKAKQEWPEPPRNPLYSLFWKLLKAKSYPNYDSSFAHADLINVPNPTEAEITRKDGYTDKTITILPFGLTPERLKSFQDSAANAQTRLASKTIAFIGTWHPRKGSKDWPRIVQEILSRDKSVKFLFLGTLAQPAKTINALSLPPAMQDNVQIYPEYDSDELPRLLRSATIGVFPSYQEGFGFSVLEKIASGLPTLAYDVSGPDDILKNFPEWLVPEGDITELVNRVIGLLNTPEKAYSKYALKCIEEAARFNWPDIAQGTANAYEKGLSQLT